MRPTVGPSALLLALALPLAGCATLFTGTVDRLSFTANVPGVRLSVDGMPKGELPLTVEMSRNFMGGQLFVARFERPGYRTQEFRLQREFNAVAILDVSSPLTSGGIDVLSGALMQFSPRDYHLELQPEGAGPPEEAALRRADVHRLALVGFGDLQRELARGEGEHLDALAWLASGGDPAAAARLGEALRQEGPPC